MVKSNRRKTRKKFLYFFLNDKIHKVIKSSRPKDELIAWCYPDKKRMLYSYSQVEKNMKTAYSMTQVAKILNKHKVTIEDYILDGKIKAPSKIYPIGDPENKNWSKYMFNESDILDLHQFILDAGYHTEIPSKTELLAILRNNLILYTKTEEGKFVPVWKAE